jgi:fructose-1,6-bisphosphatase I
MENAIEVVKQAVIEVYKKLDCCDLIKAGNLVNLKNKTDDDVIEIDQEANQVFEETILKSEYFYSFISEENEDIKYNNNITSKTKYMIACDPIDGSKNIDINITTGTIFTIFKLNSENKAESGRDIVCSGYSLFGVCTQLIISTKESTNIYQLNSDNEFIFVKEMSQMPNKSSSYSINQGYSNLWTNPKIGKFVNNQMEKGISLRFVGSMVADVNRALIKGGSFMYPGNKNNKNGKLRLLYEVMPMAYIFENLGGIVINDKEERILDLKIPKNIHERSTILMFNQKDYNLFKSM